MLRLLAAPLRGAVSGAGALPLRALPTGCALRHLSTSSEIRVPVEPARVVLDSISKRSGLFNVGRSLLCLKALYPMADPYFRVNDFLAGCKLAFVQVNLALYREDWAALASMCTPRLAQVMRETIEQSYKKEGLRIDFDPVTASVDIKSALVHTADFRFLDDESEIPTIIVRFDVMEAFRIVNAKGEVQFGSDSPRRAVHLWQFEHATPIPKDGAKGMYDIWNNTMVFKNKEDMIKFDWILSMV